MSNPESPMTPVLTVSGADRAYSKGNSSMMRTLSLNIIVFPEPVPEQDQIRNAVVTISDKDKIFFICTKIAGQWGLIGLCDELVASASTRKQGGFPRFVVTCSTI